jgi:hypothetical protein
VLFLPRHDITTQGGFYCAFGETIPDSYDDARMARVFFNLRAPGAPWLLGLLSNGLNRSRIPFRFKCLSNPRAFDMGRGDSAVLYLPRRCFGAALSLLRQSWNTLRGWLNEEIPLFARELKPGLSAADDPATAESFGQSRMRLVSLGLLDAWNSGKTDLRSRFAAVYRRFEIASIPVSQPHLNPGNLDLYDWDNFPSEP